MTYENNKLIINEFVRLAKKIKYHDIELSLTNDEKKKNIFRLSKIENAIEIFKKFPIKIISGEQFVNFFNVGKKIRMRINEILQNGKLSELDNFNFDENQKYIDNLTSILGIGYKNAYKLVYKHKIHNVDELIMSISKNEIKVSPMILKSLRYHNIYEKKIPHDEITKTYEIILKSINTIKNINIICIICGSYRRKLPYSNDIDLLISIKNEINNVNYLELIIKKLKNENIIIESLTNDNIKTKYMGFLKINNNPVRKIDIRYVKYISFYTSLLYFTGSKNFNTNMRKLAKKQGYKLNEYGLFKNKKQIKVYSEKDIFDTLNMQFVNPSDRN